MSDDAPKTLRPAEVHFSQDLAHDVRIALTVDQAPIHMAHRQLSHRDGPRIGRALASSNIADSHVARAAKVVHHRVTKWRSGNVDTRGRRHRTAATVRLNESGWRGTGDGRSGDQ